MTHKAHFKSPTPITPAIRQPRIPYDRWRPSGGGSHRDIFRKFNVQPAEEADFLRHWAERGSAGIFARDATGILVYDPDGTSWLTQFRHEDLSNFPSVFDASGQSVQYDGRIGYYGPSGLTVADLVAHQQFGADDRETGHDEPSGLAAEEPVLAQQGATDDGRIGLYGPSELTVRNFVARQRIEAELRRGR
ncbi:hypothetical protein N0V90_008945 [Kalmusia sp. IMI 367209]|nr:hypothetical protein N0V90_008945 [Kalmusia sp. IMI 367209]